MSPVSMLRSVPSIWTFIKTRLAADRERRDFQAEYSLLDALRHADFNSHKYLVTFYMKSGRTIVGRTGSGDYDHESYHRHRGTLKVLPERECPDGVFYEHIEVLFSQVEGFLIQDVACVSPIRAKNLDESSAS